MLGNFLKLLNTQNMISVGHTRRGLELVLISLPDLCVATSSAVRRGFFGGSRGKV